MAMIATANTSPPSPAKLLVGNLTLKLKEQEAFWRKNDAEALMESVRAYLDIDLASEARHARVQSMLQKLNELPEPKHATLNLLAPGGTTHVLNIPTRFVESFKVVDGNCRVQTSATTIDDVKKHVEAKWGFVGSTVLLFSGTGSEDDEEKCDLEDALTLEECSITSGQTLFLVIDSDRQYWARHAALARKHKMDLVQGYKLMIAFSKQLDLRTKQRTHRFLKNCRKVLAFMMEKPATHKVRPLEHIERIQQIVMKTLMPIIVAMRTRAGQLESPA